MSRRRHSGDNDGLYILLVVLLVLAVPVYVAEKLNNKQADAVMNLLETIKILLIVGTVLVVCYYIYKIFFESAVEDRRERRREEKKRLSGMASDEQMNKTGFSEPEREPISGSYLCSSCGAWTHIKNEVFPAAVCKFCGAALPELAKTLRYREDRYNELYNKRLDIQKDERHEERLLNHQETMKKLQNEMDEARMINEAREKAKKRQHIQIIITVILFIILTILAVSFMGKMYR